MLRPKDEQWWEVQTTRQDKEDVPAKRWLQMSRDVMRRAMYDRRSKFIRATKEGDNDFAAFGNACISVEHDLEQQTLLYRCWHLRDMVWADNERGDVNRFYRTWKPSVAYLCKKFPGKMPATATELSTTKPHEPWECLHVIKEAKDWDPPAGMKWRKPWVSIYIEKSTGEILEEVDQWNKMYCLPRWQTVSGSQYGYSPATICGLPDARLIQAMTLTLMEAGEKAANPPLVAVKQALRSDINIQAGKITYLDAEYDERTGEALRPINQDYGGFPLGMEMLKDLREMFQEAFMLNKIAMPGPVSGMTATEASERVKEYVRNALPLFEPMEQDYNGELCDLTFDILRRGNAMGSFWDMPPSLRGADIQFGFKSPLSDALDAQRAQKLEAAQAMIAAVANIDPTVVKMLNARVALRDALEGVGVPETWIASDEEMQAAAQQAQQAQAAQQAIAGITAGATAGKAVGDAASSLKTAGLIGPGAAAADATPSPLAA